MVGWHYLLDAHGFGWTMGVGDGQRGLVSCSPWGHKESDRTELLTELKIMVVYFNFLRNLCTVFHSFYTHLHSTNSAPGIPFLQLVLSVVILIIAILIGVR